MLEEFVAMLEVRIARFYYRAVHGLERKPLQQFASMKNGILVGAF